MEEELEKQNTDDKWLAKIAKYIQEDNGNGFIANGIDCPVMQDTHYTLKTINHRRGDVHILKECYGKQLEDLYNELVEGKPHSYTVRWKDEDGNGQQSYYYGSAKEVCNNFLSTHSPREFTVSQNADA